MTERPQVTFGDALCDDELIELRWDHRKRLRLLSDDFVRSVDASIRASRTPKAQTFDPRIAEVEIRHAASELEKPLLCTNLGRGNRGADAVLEEHVR